MSNTAKLIIAIVLVLVMIPVTSVVYVKDNMHNSSYCSVCHEEYYVTWVAPEEEYSLAHQHNQMGVSCQSCHQRTLEESVMEAVNYITGNYYYPFPKTELSMDNCFVCHEDYAQIIPPTDPAVTKATRNPHDGHWGELECSECHNAHQDSVVYCDECHKEYMEADAPGWTEYVP